jgi:1-acyl-sn-glycerol-3-phosphate acyltransferase/nucleoside-diphosphate-sugar epimerase
MGSTLTTTIRPDIEPDTSAQSRESNLTIVAGNYQLAEIIAGHLTKTPGLTSCNLVAASAFVFSDPQLSGAVLYLPSMLEDGMVPDMVEAANVFDKCAHGAVEWVVLVSSAAVYGASFRNPGLLSELYPLPKDQKPVGIAAKWRKFEGLANRHCRNGVCKNGVRLTVLRCSTVLSKQSANRMVRPLVQWAATTMPGHDPCIQLLSPADLAHAVDCVLQTGADGIFNVAPDGVIPLRQALKRAGTRRIPIPRTILRIGCALRGLTTTSDLNFARYPWTVSNEKIKALGFNPRLSSLDALAEFCPQLQGAASLDNDQRSGQFDDFGMDQEYIQFFGRTLFRFLADWYWRIEVAGVENIPQNGRAVLAGIHRGFMPWDGVMALDVIVKRTGRYPRFLIHPGLVKFPFLANFMTKLGGIIACQENARRVLESDQLLGVFPEGIQGAFVPYSQAYQIHDFHRDAFVKMALRHQAPIVPFVTVGSAEIFPILAKLKSPLWTKYSEWPAFPITPTFPVIPLPLPSKWHMRFLPALHIQNNYPPTAAAETAVVRTISREVRNRMQNAIDEILLRRPSIFFGSAFAVGTK